jgi:hypothetical protein
MAVRAAQLALFIVKLMAAARAPAPVFTPDLTRSGTLNRRGRRARILVIVGGHSKLFG